MSSLGAQDIAINRLRVSGDKRAALKLARELEQESWPLHLPANMHKAWVFVRELQVNGDQRFMRQQTAQQLAALISHAVDARHAGANAQVVCFASLPELLAFLLRDLALGQVAGKWYWQRWSYLLRASREQAIAGLLCENLAELPAVIEQLAALGELQRVWQFVSGATANTIARQLASFHHIPLPLSNAEANSPADQIIQQTAKRQFQQHKTFLQAWKPLLLSISKSDYRWVLAALISGITYCPLLIIRTPSAVVNAFMAELNESSSKQEMAVLYDIAKKNPKAYPPANLLEEAKLKNKFGASESYCKDLASSEPASAANGENIQETTVRHSELPLASEPLKPAWPQAEDFPFQSLTEALPPDTKEQAFSMGELPTIMDSYEPMQSPASISLQNTGFITQSGGIFYLINALRQVLTPEFLAEHSLNSAWWWLLDCGRLWARQLGLELDQELLRFMALNLAYDNLQALAAQSVFPESQALFTRLEQRFGAESFWSDAGVLARLAWVTADASHIDVFYALSSVRLDVRLAGLDVNPGWVPWLGRVVTFHYIESVPHEEEHHGD